MPVAEFKYNVAVQCCSRDTGLLRFIQTVKIYVVYRVGIVNAQIDLTEVKCTEMDCK